MKIPFYQVDAFSSKVFGGNPAAVCILEKWLEDEMMQGIATENNLSETAFLVPIETGRYKLRWFTPFVEIDLCGHATLASAHVIFSFIEKSVSSVDFETPSGVLSVTNNGESLSMNFPSRKPVQIDPPRMLSRALGLEPDEVLKARDVLAVFENETIIRSIIPDFGLMMQIPDTFAIIVTAPGNNSDFVSRFFAPNVGIPEDPVTGSSHCTLIPYWSERLNKQKLHAFQLSRRGGELFCENHQDMVTISGHSVLYAKGEIYI